MKVVWSPLALERIGEIAQRIAFDRPIAARQWVEEIFESVRGLGTFPRSGRRVPEAEHRSDLREVIHGSYRVIYREDSDRIFILTIRHSRQVTDVEDLDPTEGT